MYHTLLDVACMHSIEQAIEGVVYTTNPPVTPQIYDLFSGSGSLVIALALGVFVCIALPAVWSRDPARREAAYRVLKLISDAACRALKSIRQRSQ